MADQNQNSQNPIPGTLRTLKTDLEGLNTSPQDRLQQAGNFVQARPSLEPTTKPVDNSGAISLNSIPSSSQSTINTQPEIKTEVKKDVPTNSTPASESKPNYSWSNMNSSAGLSAFKSNTTSDVVKTNAQKTNTAPVNDVKPSFSVLDSNIDLPMDTKSDSANDFNLDTNNTKNTSQTNPENPMPASPINNFDINSLNLQDDEEVSKPKSSSKGLISAIVVIVLITLIGGGVYFYFNMSRTPNTNNTTDNNTNSNNNQAPTPTPTPTVSPLFTNSQKLDIAFVDTQPIRQTILSQLSSQRDPLIELNLTKDGNKVAIADVADALSLTIPAEVLDVAEEYWLYGYNQQGVYKLTGVLQLKSDQNANSLIDSWSTSIPRDLSGFSINSPSRIVNTPTIKQSSVSGSNSRNFKNYYYNYTSPTDSIDVSSFENYILMASSQDSMKYLLNQIP